MPYIRSLITPADSLLQLYADQNNSELLILSDANIRSAINNKPDNSTFQSLTKTVNGISDILNGISPINEITGLIAGTNYGYSKNYIDSNYYTRSIIDSTYATLNYVRSNFPQKFVIKHTANDPGFYKFLYITVP